MISSTCIEVWYAPLMWALGTGASCVAGALVILLRPRPRNRRRHSLGRKLQLTGTLRRMR